MISRRVSSSTIGHYLPADRLPCKAFQVLGQLFHAIECIRQLSFDHVLRCVVAVFLGVLKVDLATWNGIGDDLVLPGIIPDLLPNVTNAARLSSRAQRPYMQGTEHLAAFQHLALDFLGLHRLTDRVAHLQIMACADAFVKVMMEKYPLPGHIGLDLLVELPEALGNLVIFPTETDTGDEHIADLPDGDIFASSHRTLL